MPLKPPKIEGIKIELIPEGSYYAVCYAVVDLGTRTKEYMGNEKDVHELLISFELPKQRITIERDGNEIDMPKVCSMTNTFSMHEKANLRKYIETWRGKSLTELEAQDFDFEKLLGIDAMIQILHRKSKDGSKTYANISSITPPDSGIKKCKTENEHIFYTFQNGLKFPESMHDWIKEKIMNSKEALMIMDARKDFDAEVIEPNMPDLSEETSEDIPF